MAVRGFLLVLFKVLIFNSSLTWAQSTNDVCPVDMKLGYQERQVFESFNARFVHLNYYYGKPLFQAKLNEIIETSWPEDLVIDVSASFMEQTLKLVQIQHLKDLIQKTIGLDNYHWIRFSQYIQNVAVKGLTMNKKLFVLHSEYLMKELEKVNASNIRRGKGLSEDQIDLLKARTATSLADVFIYLQRWNLINQEIRRQNIEALKKQALIVGIGAVSGGIMLGGTIYMGTVMATARTLAAKQFADPIVAARMGELARVVSGAGLGAVGAPAVMVAGKSTSSLFYASALSSNNGTVYACELDKQIKAWKAEGVSPYLKAALGGAGMGMLGALAFSKLGAKALFAATYSSTAIAQLYTFGLVKDETILALAEYRYAQEAFNKGDKELARKHRQQGRLHAAKAKENLVDTIVIGILSTSLAANFRSALQSNEAVMVTYANSADTIPEVKNIILDMLSSQ